MRHKVTVVLSGIYYATDNDVTEVKINLDDDARPLFEFDKNARR